jgi:hypothetical protein
VTQEDCPSLIEYPPREIEDSPTLEHMSMRPVRTYVMRPVLSLSSYATYKQLDYGDLSEAQAMTDADLEDQEIDAADNHSTKIPSKINHFQYDRLTLDEIDMLIQCRLPPFNRDVPDQDPRNLSYFESLSTSARRSIQMRLLHQYPHYINASDEWIPRVHRGIQCYHCSDCYNSDSKGLYLLGSLYSSHSLANED